MAHFFFNLVAFLFIICGCTCDESYSVQGKNLASWLDPGDMLETDLSSSEKYNNPGDQKQEEVSDSKVTNKEVSQDIPVKSVENLENEHFAAAAENPRQNCELPYFKQVTRIVIESFQRPGKHYVAIELSENHLRTLNEFMDKDRDGDNIHDVLEVMSDIFSRVQQDEREAYSLWSMAAMTIQYNKETFAVLFIFVTLIVVLLVFETRTSLSWQRQFWYFLVVLFFISIPWEWFRLYRKEFAKKQSEVMKEIPRQCVANSMTISQSISLWMVNLLSWRDDECSKYQEAILVDPVWEVSPSQAFSITATRFFAKPLEYIADACGRSFNAFFLHIPVQWQPFMFVGIAIMTFVCIILVTKSRIKFGFFEIGPSVSQQRPLRNEDIDAIGEAIGKRLQEGVIQRGVQADRARRLDELPGVAAVHDEKGGNRSIKYGVRESQRAVHDLPVGEASS